MLISRKSGQNGPLYYGQTGLNPLQKNALPLERRRVSFADKCESAAQSEVGRSIWGYSIILISSGVPHTVSHFLKNIHIHKNIYKVPNQKVKY